MVNTTSPQDRSSSFPANQLTLTPYQLPDRTVVLVDATAAKGAQFIDYTLADGRIVIADRVRRCAHCGGYARYGQSCGCFDNGSE